MYFWEDEEKNKIGKLGIKLVQLHCEENYLNFRLATIEEDREKGIDCFINDVATDIKNTHKIFLGNYDKNKKKFFTRHPFKKTTGCEQYCILDTNPKEGKYNIKYLGSIREYLSTNYFKDIQAIIIIFNILQKYDKNDYKSLGFNSAEQLLLSLKKEILPLLRKNVNCRYDNYEVRQERVAIYLY